MIGTGTGMINVLWQIGKTVITSDMLNFLEETYICNHIWYHSLVHYAGAYEIECAFVLIAIEFHQPV